MRLDEYIEGFERDEAAERRRLAREKSYAITDYLDEVEDRFNDALSGGSLVGSTAPSIFVGHSNYPKVSTGLLSPVGDEEHAAEYATDGTWYRQGLSIEDVVQRRTGLLNANRFTDVRAAGLGPTTGGTDAPSVHDVWDGFVGTQREVAIADRPVGVEIGLSDSRLEFDLPDGDTAAPRGPRAGAESATLTENPHVPRPVEKTLEDDDWRAEGAMTYLYRRGFDVYEINRILSAGALGEAESRRLVPTRWSITAVDDTVGKYLRGSIRSNPSVDETRVFSSEYMGNRYWAILSPGNWEFELVEMKAPGSVWNPVGSEVWIASDHEGYEGRTKYVDGGTAGAYYATRLAALEYLEEIGRQAKVLVLRHVSDEYWAPVGVWQIRESVRDAFEGESGVAETLHDAVRGVEPLLPISTGDLRRSSEMVAGVQASLADFST
ncbi:DNA repair protein NreA [Halalkalicoccus sp. NIPERK01]|uniref:DNA repair protein NreA n=1 Tax=Halalkalicoccus sp. NIPERK01 TaxID=3053469 RepID=UPI00256F0616|nr:DNA repair protein NreA [Halalkalicoccus sp. NIPERK01]MDL5361912.1 DNA repair protein NreA [Halalkalicoccus sp. NIPERK01]